MIMESYELVGDIWHKRLNTASVPPCRSLDSSPLILTALWWLISTQQEGCHEKSRLMLDSGWMIFTKPGWHRHRRQYWLVFCTESNRYRHGLGLRKAKPECYVVLWPPKEGGDHMTRGHSNKQECRTKPFGNNLLSNSPLAVAGSWLARYLNWLHVCTHLPVSTWLCFAANNAHADNDPWAKFGL